MQEAQQMQDIPSFFIDQRLDQDVDERTIKRAYAKALKQIDQESDLTGFQDLRESYEYAINWARHRDWLAQQTQEQEEQFSAEQELPTASSTTSDQAQVTQPACDSHIDHANEVMSEEAAKAVAVAAASAIGELLRQELKQESNPTIDKDIPASPSTLEQAPYHHPTTLMSLAPEEPVREPTVETASTLLTLDDAVDSSPPLPSLVQVDTATPKVVVEDIPQGPSPIDVAKEVMEEVLQRIQQLNDENADLLPLLRDAMDDDRLINVEARDVFEWLMANHVAQGWQAGNGNLFGATVKAFQWNEDKNRLLRFGELGYYLEHALVEMSMFNDQDRALADRQVQLIRRARAATLPDKHFLRENIQLIHHMTSSFPNWLNLVTSWTNLQAWRTRAEELKIVPQPVAAKGSAKEESSFSKYGGLWIFAIFLLLSIVRGCSNDKPYTPTYQPDRLSQRMAGKNLSVDELNAERQFLLGEDYYFGRDNKPQNYKNAETAWLAAAQTDHMDAIVHLADLYADPKTGLENLELAHKYRLKAAEGGKTRMYFGVANDFLLGRGVAKDEKLGFEWTEKAVDSGEKQALNNLAYLYERGTGVKKDPQKALEYYERGAVAGEPVPLRNAGMSYLSGQLGIKDFEKGYAYVKKSAEKSYVRAQYDLGLIAEKGLYNQTKDLEQAAQWYERAIKQGSEDAKKRLQAMCKLKQYAACSQLNTVSSTASR